MTSLFLSEGLPVAGQVRSWRTYYSLAALMQLDRFCLYNVKSPVVWIKSIPAFFMFIAFYQGTQRWFSERSCCCTCFSGLCALFPHAGVKRGLRPHFWLVGELFQFLYTQNPSSRIKAAWRILCIYRFPVTVFTTYHSCTAILTLLPLFWWICVCFFVVDIIRLRWFCFLNCTDTGTLTEDFLSVGSYFQ